MVYVLGVFHWARKPRARAPHRSFARSLVRGRNKRNRVSCEAILEMIRGGNLLLGLLARSLARVATRGIAVTTTTIGPSPANDVLISRKRERASRGGELNELQTSREQCCGAKLPQTSVSDVAAQGESFQPSGRTVASRTREKCASEPRCDAFSSKRRR